MSEPDRSEPDRSEPDRSEPERSVMLAAATRALFPTVLVFSIYLLLVGHYGPGGGFSAGLVAGLAFVLRYIANGPDDVTAAMPLRPPAVIGTGLLVALLAALAPVAFGAPVLSSEKLQVDVALLGPIQLQSSIFLDVGVYLLIVGVVVDLLRSLGAGIERDMHDAGEQ